MNKLTLDCIDAFKGVPTIEEVGDEEGCLAWSVNPRGWAIVTGETARFLNSGALSLEIISNEFTDDATLALRNWIVANHIDVPAVLEDVANYIYHTWDTGGDATFLYTILPDDRCCTSKNSVDAGLIGDQPPIYAILENEKIMKAKENENTAALNKTVTENSSFNMSFKAITTNENTIEIHVSERYNSNFTTGLAFNDVGDFDAFVDFLVYHKNNMAR